jgi:hypothetical protein
MSTFKPRSATLHHASNGDVSVYALACGLVYVGDQLARANLLAEYQVLRDRINTSLLTEPRATAYIKELEQELWPE